MKTWKKLDRISALNDNWDGYGAESLPEYLIISASELIRKLRIQPEIFPTADGTIQIEYEKDNGESINAIVEAFTVKIASTLTLKPYTLFCINTSRYYYGAYINE